MRPSNKRLVMFVIRLERRNVVDVRKFFTAGITAGKKCQRNDWKSYDRRPFYALDIVN